MNRTVNFFLLFSWWLGPIGDCLVSIVWCLMNQGFENGRSVLTVKRLLLSTSFIYLDYWGGRFASDVDTLVSDYTDVHLKRQGFGLAGSCFETIVWDVYCKIHPHENLICVWPCIISVGKVIQRSQLDATITIHWSPISAQHVSGNPLPIFRSVTLRSLQHMVYCPVVVVGRVSESGNVALRVHYEGSSKHLLSYRTRSATLPLSEPLPTTTTGDYTICCKNLSLTLLKMGKRLPETCWADLGDQ